jgi:hypothetical protein
MDELLDSTEDEEKLSVQFALFLVFFFERLAASWKIPVTLDKIFQ